MTHTPALSRQQRLFNAWARYAQRPSLLYIKSPRLMRFLSDLTAPLTHKRPANMLLAPMTLRHDGATVSATACTIKHQPMEGTLLYLHGGGFVLGSLKMYQHLVASLGQAADMRGVYVDYRLAPEHPFPAALDDAVTAYQALIADPDTGPIAIAGDSAGGNLVFVLLLKIKALGLPMPSAAVAMSPVVNLTEPYPSFTANADSDHLLPPEWALRSAKGYVAGHDQADPFVSPIRGDFTGAPPTMIHYDTTEALADDSIKMVAHLRSLGVSVQTEVATGRMHVWHLHVGRIPEADASVAVIGAFLRANR